jgi:hypothetical protein
MNAKKKRCSSSELTLEDLFACLRITRSEVVEMAFRLKSGRCSSDDHRNIFRCWSKLRKKKWAHLCDEYSTLREEGERKAIKLPKMRK